MEEKVNSVAKLKGRSGHLVGIERGDGNLGEDKRQDRLIKEDSNISRTAYDSEDMQGGKPRDDWR